MWSEKLQNGKVRYVERYKDPLTLKDKKISITMSKDTAANRKTALEELTRKIESAQCLVTTDNITLQQLYDRYIAYQIKTVKASTVERNTRTLKKLVKTFGNDVIVDKLTVSYITDKLLGMHVSAVTMNEYIRRFKAMANWGKQMELHSNYKLCDNLTYFKETSTKRERIQDKYLEPDEIKTILEYMINGECWQWYYLTKFLLLSGLRIGEAIALENVDVGNKYISVRKTFDNINKIVTTPKTLTSNRDVFIQPELTEVIKQYNLYCREQDLQNDIRSPLFFHSRKGDYISYWAYEKYLRESAEHVLGRKITAHVLRHTHASLLLAEGISIDTISRRLGHENSQITKRIYLHVVEKLKQNDDEQIKLAKIL